MLLRAICAQHERAAAAAPRMICHELFIWFDEKIATSDRAASLENRIAMLPHIDAHTIIAIMPPAPSHCFIRANSDTVR